MLDHILRESRKTNLFPSVIWSHAYNKSQALSWHRLDPAPASRGQAGHLPLPVVSVDCTSDN